MSVPAAYLTKANIAGPVLEAVQKAGVPDKFTYDFLRKQLGFTSSSDRPMIAVLKALRFLDESGVPMDRYRRYKDPAQSRLVLAEAMRDAYSDIFAGDQRAHEMNTTALKGVFARVSGKGDSVSQKMAATFKTLADLADFDALPQDDPSPPVADSAEAVTQPSAPVGRTATSDRVGGVQLHHDVHVHLPVSTEIAVYDAIFRSMRENLSA